MGCENSTSFVQKTQNLNQYQRKNKFRSTKKINQIKNKLNQIQENVIKSEKKPDFKDFQLVQKIIKLSSIEQKKFLENLLIYQAPQKEYIFKKGDTATLFFIIKSGKVVIELNDQEKNTKQISKGQCFGQLALIYTSNRSASVKTLQKCQFLCISNSVFRLALQQITKKNYQFAKTYINKITQFKYLTSKQKSNLAHNAHYLKFNQNQIIFKEGDDANSFYFIVEGKVRLQIPSKTPIHMVKGQTFGQNSFKKNQVRSGTAICQTQTHLLGISRQSINKCLKGQISELVFYNIMRWSLKRLTLFKKFSNSLIEKIINKCQIKFFKDGQIIMNKQQPAKFLILCLEGKINGEGPGHVFNSQYLISLKQKQQRVFTKKLIKQGNGHVCFILFSTLQSLFCISLEDIVRRSQIQEGVFEYTTLKKYQLSQMQLNDLKIIRQLGKGHFGVVFQVQNQTGYRLALKCIQKDLIIQKQMELFIQQQKEVLAKIEHPFIVPCYRTFKNQNYIFFLLKLIDGKDFFEILREIGLLNHQMAAFYLGCLIQAIEYLHNNNIVYRDLKPQNVVTDKSGYLIMIDLGAAKILKEQNGYRTFTIIGTPHYLAPEVLQGKGYSFPVDIWSLGIVLYEMVCGRVPFGQYNNDPFQIYKEIIKSRVTFPKYYHDENGKTFINLLLTRQPEKRNIQQFSRLKNDPYFYLFNWDKLKSKKLTPPYISKEIDSKNQPKINQKVVDYLNKLKSVKQSKNLISKVPNWDKDFS